MEKVALYARVSTEEQARHGLSIEAQLTTLREWANKEGVVVVGEYVDAGVSARKPASKRPELTRLLQDIEAGKITLVVFIKLDRWFRNVGEYYKVQEVLDRHKVAWRAILEDYETQTASGRFKINIMLSVAQDEADRTSERVKYIKADIRSRGKLTNGRVPPGYISKDGVAVIDPAKADIMRECFRHFISVQSVNELRKWALETYGELHPYNHWRLYLRNEIYTGRLEGKQVFEPLISDDDFALVQKILSDRSPRNAGQYKHHTYLFTGKIFCAECGKKMVTHACQQSTYIYYRCPTYIIHRCEHQKRHNEKSIEQWLRTNILEHISSYNAELKKRPAPKPVDTAPIKRKLEKLWDLYSNDLIDRDMYETEYNKLQAQLKAAESAIIEMPKPIDIKSYQDALQAYDTLTPELRREFWQRSIDRLYISNNGDISLSLSWL